MYFLRRIQCFLIISIGSIFFAISLFGTVYSQDGNSTVNAVNGNNSQNNENPDSTVNELIQLIGVLGGIAIPTVGARFIVNKWQQKKETSEIRQKIFKNFQQSIKDYVVLMDTFVAKILLRFASSNQAAKGNILIDVLPFGYEVDQDMLREQDLERYPDLVGLSDVDVPRILELIKRQAFSFTDRTQKDKKFLDSEFCKFEEAFFNKRASVTEFLSGVRQYYKNGEELNNKIDYLWNEIMTLHILVRLMVETQDENEFISLAKHFKSLLDQSFARIRKYDHELAVEKIRVE
jgi:hypothetical protein